jgi:hypothetical protein
MDPLSLCYLSVPNIGQAAAEGLVHARDILALILQRFYTPRQLVMFLTIERDRRFEFVRWLRIVELMVRRTLFAEASAIATSLPPPSPSRAAGTRADHKPEPYSEDPETWRTSFQVAPRSSRAGRPVAPHGCGERRDFLPAMPLARRIEAILRVVRDPHPFIQRLALRLRRGVARYRRLIDPFDCFYALARPTLRDLARACEPRFADSS